MSRVLLADRLTRCAGCGQRGAVIHATTRADDPARLCGPCDLLERERQAGALRKRQNRTDALVLGIAFALLLAVVLAGHFLQVAG